MSTLDRAFIKAYQKQRVIPAPHVAFPPAEALDEIERARIDPTQNDAAPVEPKPVRAALEVEQFDWPETVETLRLASVDYFNAWSEQFADVPGVTVLAASDARGAGRTTVLLAAARHLSLSRPEAKIALVDADFRHPELAARLGVALDIGWEHVLAGSQPLAEALVESNSDRITLLPLTAELDDDRLAVGAERLRESLSSLQRSFDFVCIDAGPLDSAAELAAFGRELKIDAALIVRDMRRAGDEDNSAIGRRLAQLGVRHWDLVENFVQAKVEVESLLH